MTKLGTEEDRIQLVPDNAKRKALEDSTGIGSSVDVVIDMSKMKAPKQAFDLFLKNLIRNPRLSADEIRLGFLLFDLLENEGAEQSFLVVPASDFHMSQVGADGMLYFNGTRHVSYGFEILEKQSLLDIACQYRLDVERSTLIALLNKLHSFFYITCTEICEQNLAANRAGFNYKDSDVLLSENAKMVHIRINDRFNEIDLTKRWGKLIK